MTDIEFTVGEPIAATEIPARTRGFGVFAAIWKAAANLEDGQVLPVTFSSQKRMRNCQISAAGTRRLGQLYKVTIRGTTAYVSRRENGARDA